TARRRARDAVVRGRRRGRGSPRRRGSERADREHRGAPAAHGDGAPPRSVILRRAGDGGTHGPRRRRLRARTARRHPARSGSLALHPVMRRNWAPAVGLLLGLAGVVGYFVVVLFAGGRLAAVRNDAIPNLLIVGLGFACSVLGVARARRGARRLAGVLAGLNVGIAAWFVWLLFGMSRVPIAAGPVIGSTPADFALAAPDSHAIHLTELRGAPL